MTPVDYRRWKKDAALQGGACRADRDVQIRAMLFPDDPAMYDMFVGGVVGAGESYQEAALREAEEELGVQGLPAPAPLFRFLYETPEHTWWSAVYEVRCDQPVRPQVEEVAWHTFLTEEELSRRLSEWSWVPDGVVAWRRLLAWDKESAEKH